MYSDQGFSLIELLVVVAIIGVLAAVGVVSFNGFIENSKQNVVKANHNNIVKYFQLKAVECEMDGKITISIISNPGQTAKKSSASCVYNNGWSLVMNLGYNYFKRQFMSDNYYSDNWINPYVTGLNLNPEWNNGCSNTKGQTSFYGINTGTFKICTNTGSEKIWSYVQFPVY